MEKIMNPEGLKFGGFKFSMARTQIGSGSPLTIGPDTQLPDSTALNIYIRGDWFVPNSTFYYGEFFRFINFEFETNVLQVNTAGGKEVTTFPYKKELNDDSFLLELSVFPVRASWTIEANLILTIQKKSTGEIFKPRYEFKLGPLHKDILGFGVNERLSRTIDIVLNTTAPYPSDQFQLPPNPESMRYFEIQNEIAQQTADLYMSMKEALISSQNQNPDPGGTGELGLIPDTASQPWYIDQSLYEQAMASGGLTAGIVSIFIDSMRQYYQTVSKIFGSFWEVQELHKEFLEMYKIHHMTKNVNNYQWWEIKWVQIRIQIMIIESLPGFEKPIIPPPIELIDTI